MFLVIVFDDRSAGVENTSMLLLFPSHLPPEIAQRRIGEKQMRESEVNLGNQPFDLGERQQSIERLVCSHAVLKLPVRLNQLMYFSELPVIESIKTSIG